MNQRKKQSLQCLEKVGMGNRGKQIVQTMSGGQRQRVAIARALINNPSVILADEPTGALDTENQNIIFRMLTDLVSEGKTLIIATHNLDIANRCDKKISMLDGVIIGESHADSTNKTEKENAV
ncbi:MAG: ATP-binding cassette domain-containing protein [Clostridiaceae bacterium]|nr:ATP-binding cassette domain-containing protein [Clostridiaceae bacterium]